MSDKDKAAPVGEREAFEAALAAGALPDSFFHERHPGMWVAFQLGAAYQRAQQPQSEYGDAYQGAREDLAIWKRRALEAESRVREQDQIIENLGNALNAENGPTFMGEPVIQQPQRAEAVSAQVRFRRPEKGMPGWSVWQQTSIKPNMQVWSIDSAGYEVEYRLLYTTPQPSAAVVMPPIPYKPELADADLTDYEKGELQGRCDMWAEFARLNGKEVGRG